jgi:hypothetical protein
MMPHRPTPASSRLPTHQAFKELLRTTLAMHTKLDRGLLIRPSFRIFKLPLVCSDFPTHMGVGGLFLYKEKLFFAESVKAVILVILFLNSRSLTGL